MYRALHFLVVYCNFVFFECLCVSVGYLSAEEWERGATAPHTTAPSSWAPAMALSVGRKPVCTPPPPPPTHTQQQQQQQRQRRRGCAGGAGGAIAHVGHRSRDPWGDNASGPRFVDAHSHLIRWGWTGWTGWTGAGRHFACAHTTHKHSRRALPFSGDWRWRKGGQGEREGEAYESSARTTNPTLRTCRLV